MLIHNFISLEKSFFHLCFENNSYFLFLAHPRSVYAVRIYYFHFSHKITLIYLHTTHHKESGKIAVLISCFLTLEVFC